MPEIGEIARLVHFLRKHIVGKKIASVQVVEDSIVYGKAGTTGPQFKQAVEGKKVIDVGRQGKYFWLILDSPPHPLLHCSMTGWIKLNNDDTSYYREAKKDEEWPPKFWKFILTTDEDPPCEAAYVDPRRLGRIRLIDCPATQIREMAPLNLNGPDPVLDRPKVTEQWVIDTVRSKKVPIKAFLLDQSYFSGVGNWVADEILFNARLHPEQYTNSFSDDELIRLQKSVLHVCAVAVDTLADSEKFPKEWLMKYRWDKGKKQDTLPNGEKIEFLTIRGRTSAYVPNLQKKTGPVAVDLPAHKLKALAAGAASPTEAKPPLGERKRKRGDEAGDDGEQGTEASAPEVNGRRKAKMQDNKKTKKKKGVQAVPVRKTPFQRKKAKRESPRKARQIRQGKRPPD